VLLCYDLSMYVQYVPGRMEGGFDSTSFVLYMYMCTCIFTCHVEFEAGEGERGMGLGSYRVYPGLVDLACCVMLVVCTNLLYKWGRVMIFGVA
jgi:hypothetical protein